MLAFFERLIRPFPPEEPVQPPATLLAFLRHYTRGMGAPLLLMSALTATLAILEVMLFGFLGQLVDWLADQDRTTFLRDEGGRLLFMAVITLVVLPLVVLLQTAVIHQALLGNFPMSIRWMAHRYLLKQSLGFYQNDFAGRIATKVMQTSIAARESVMKTLDVMVYVLVYFTTMTVMLVRADVWLLLPLSIWFGCYAAIMLYFVPRLRKVSTQQADARAAMTGRIVDSYTNIATVKLFSHTAREADYARSGMSDFMTTVYRQMRLVTGFNFSVSLLNYLLVFSIAALCIGLWINQAVTVGAMAIAVGLTLRLNGQAQWIMWEVGALFENIGTVADGITTLSRPHEIIDNDNAKVLQVDQGGIEFDNVKFHYGKEEGVFEALDIAIKPGEKIGLVGRSGAGKSTLVNLLLRFHDVEGGAVRIDGQDLREVTQESLRANIGMVTQDTSLLHRSVRDNILYGRPDATEEELLAATRQAEAHEFIEGLTDPYGNTGYDAQVGERGVKLSGGQRQRIAIARVLLKNAPILILDEATSALDSEVEAAIQHSLNTLMAGKTVIAIAHRLSTIASMDRLIVMDQGRIVEQGTHSELIASGGIYAQLWAHQTGGFLGLEEAADAQTETS